MSFATSRRPVLCLLAFAFAITLGSDHAQSETPSFLQKMFQRDVSAELGNVRYELTEEDGPWMILGTTFVGDNAKTRAERSAEQIRRELKMPAFIYHENFDFKGRVRGGSANSRPMRFANAYEYEAYAVLVGEYATVNDGNVDSDLKRIKSLQLDVYSDPNEVRAEHRTDSPATTIKAFSQKLFHSRKGHAKGPMANAFVTRNPMLPEEYFSAPEVDSFVRQLNDNKEFGEHNLLKCDGKYTVVVCTFTGLGTIVDGSKEKDFVPSRKRMDKFATDARKMTLKLRKDGAEAYQFHDRYRSLVTIGSFDSLGTPMPNGGFQYNPEIRRVMQKYSAFNSQIARTIPGKNGIAANHAAMIPFDVQPTPIAVPKPSKRVFLGAVRR
ncbi:hypothetical protein [Planctomycetes bacterium K23_9]|uniref:Uncharacterized protein n=1 Tax=Stieleria marina TaxID=1930275 RepID=A0A517NS12_9BACT|nr:hypothetical protein K239x_18750 [Planctomycetes bacterium K23_9]